MLRPDQPGSRLRCSLDGRYRHHLQGQFRRPRGTGPAAELAQALHHAGAGRDAARPRLQGLRSRPSRGRPRRTRHYRGPDPDRSARRRNRPQASAVDAGIPERPELGPRRLRSHGLHHRRTRAARTGLEDADDGARRRPRHFAAVALRRRRRLCGAHLRRLCPHPRAVRHRHRQVRRHRGAAGAYCRHRLPARRRAPADLRGAQPGAPSRGHFRHHEAARHRADADCDRRRHGHPWRKGRDRRPAKLSGNLYRSVPVGITVEGANILTRNLIVFGQGAIRAHPFLLDEMNALGEVDRAKGLDGFDKAFWNHVGHSFKTMFRAWGRSWSGGLFAPAPDAGEATQFYRQLSRYSSAFALCADMALLTLGGALKRKEMLSARFGDILSELYLLSAALKRWQDEGRQQADFAALQWCMASGFRTIESRFAEILGNLPNRFVAAILKFLIQPFGARVLGPTDQVVHLCAQLVLLPSAARDRLTADLSHVVDDGGVARLEKAFLLVTAAEDISKKMHAARLHDWKEAVRKGVITQADGEKLQAAHEAVAKVIEVDDFAPEALSPIYRKAADVHQFFQELGEQRAAS